MESLYFNPFKYRIGLCAEKITFIHKKANAIVVIVQVYHLLSGSEKAPFSESQDQLVSSNFVTKVFTVLENFSCIVSP